MGQNWGKIPKLNNSNVTFWAILNIVKNGKKSWKIRYFCSIWKLFTSVAKMQFFQNSFNFWPRFGKMHLSFLSGNHFRVSVFHHFFKCIMMMEDSRKGAPALSWLKSKSFQKQHLLQMHFIFNDKIKLQIIFRAKNTFSLYI